jgi:DNA-binding response OmpR family regulator
VSALERLLDEHEGLRNSPPPAYAPSGPAPDYSKRDARSIIVHEHHFENLEALTTHLAALADASSPVAQFESAVLAVVGGDYDGLDRSIDARICRLRRKLQDAGGAESMIKTVRLRGYLFTGGE